MRAIARYSPALVALGILAALAAGAFRLVDGVVSTRVQIGIAVALVLLASYLALEVESIQKWAGGRQARYGANAVAMSVAFIAILGILNYLSSDRYHTDWDLTENQQNTLADQTLEVLGGLTEPVTATAFVSNQGGSRETTTQLLQSYHDKSNGMFSFEVVDPFVDRTRAAEMGITRDNTVVFTMGDHNEEVQLGSEQEFTSALIRLTHPEERVVYFVVGHGEPDLADTSDTGYSQIKAGLEHQNFTVQTLNLVVTDTVPSDATVLVVAGPQVALTAAEAQTIGAYLDGGGAALFLLNPTLQMREDQRDAPDPLVDWLAQTWGIGLSNDLVIDPASSQAGDAFVPFAFGYGSSPITDKLLSQNLTSQYPLARSVTPPVAGDEAFASITATGLVLTSPQAWGETDFASLQSGARPDNGVDVSGPLDLAVTAEHSDTSARIAVFGDADFITNAVAQAYANGDIFYNTVNWAAGNTDLISIPPKSPSFRAPLDQSTRTIAILGIVSVLLLPFGVLVMGVAVVLNRRARYK